jgi:predicted PurR-regulated permease PerM
LTPLPTIPSSRVSVASQILAGAVLIAILHWNLVAALLSGLLVYALVGSLAPGLQRHLSGTRAHWLVVAMLVVVVVGLITGIIIGCIAFLNSEHGNPSVLFQRISPVLDRARAQLPPSVVAYLPASPDDIRAVVVDWLRDHTAQLQGAGKQAVRVMVQIIIGIVIGAMIALHVALVKARNLPQKGPLAVALTTRSANLVTSFRDVVFAQVKISAVNTVLTGVFLLVVLPLFGVHLPLAKTLVVATFVVGLLPVIGNLISNTLIFVMGLSISIWVALAALGYLVVIHKLEYFLNARIIGTQIRARAWELLIAMLLMEALFGAPGLIVAPIYYAYLKRELEAERLI